MRKDGSRVPVHLNVSPLRDDANAVVGFIAIGSDLSERKLAEERLRNNERFMRIVTDNIPGIVAYWTTDMRCTFANSAYQRWLGRTAEQMIGTTQTRVLGPEHFRAERALHARRARRPGPARDAHAHAGRRIDRCTTGCTTFPTATTAAWCRASSRWRWMSPTCAGRRSSSRA